MSLSSTLIKTVLHDCEKHSTIIRFDLQNMHTLIQGLENIPDPAKEEFYGYEESITKSAKSIANYTVDLNNFLSLLLTNHELNPELTDFINFSRETLKLYKARVEKEKVKLVADIPNNLPSIWINKMLMERVLLNLLDNAFNYSDKQEPRVIFSLADDLNEKKVVLKIINNGEGIPRQHLPLIWSDSLKPLKERKLTIHGSGLGLVFVKNVVERHNGTVDIDSEYARTVVTIKLPYQ